MFKAKRFKQQSNNFSNAFTSDYLQITATSNTKTFSLPNSSQQSQRNQSLLIKLCSSPHKLKKYSLQHGDNPEQTVPHQIKNKPIQKNIQRMRRKQNICHYSPRHINLLKIKEEVSKAITPIMRIIMIDWLMQVVHDLKLSKQALHVAIHYLDQLLQKAKIQKNQLQIYALICLMIAQKLQSQIYLTPLQAQHLLQSQITEKELIAVEQEIMITLEYKLHPFTLWVEANILLKAFESYFKGRVGEWWGEEKKRMLWMVEGMIMESSYFEKRLLQNQIAICLLYRIVLLCDCRLIRHFPSFCKSITGSSSILPEEEMNAELNYLTLWLQRSCQCSPPYATHSYHPQLKVMAAIVYH